MTVPDMMWPLPSTQLDTAYKESYTYKSKKLFEAHIFNITGWRMEIHKNTSKDEAFLWIVFFSLKSEIIVNMTDVFVTRR